MIRKLIREYIEALLEGPVAYDDSSGMVTPTRPTIDSDEIEAEFDYNKFADMVRKEYQRASSIDDDIDLSNLSDEIANRNRKIAGIEIDKEDLEDELLHSKKEKEEFDSSTPEEKNHYHADTKRFETKF